MLVAIPSDRLDQWRLVHPILREIAKDWAQLWRDTTSQDVAVVTSIHRSRDETIRIYEQAGKQPPAISVHEMLPDPGVILSGTRGIDFATQVVGDWDVFLEDELVERVVGKLNERWRYHSDDRFQVALYHSVGAPHVHLQCRPGSETSRR